MPSYEHTGTVSLSDSKDDFDLTFEFSDGYEGSYEVHNHSEHGRFRFIIENEVTHDEDGSEYGHPHWEEVERRTLTPNDIDTGTFTGISRPIFPVSDAIAPDGIIRMSSQYFRIKIKWITTAHTGNVEYHFRIASDTDFSVEP